MMWRGIKEGKVLTDEEMGFIVNTWEFSNWFDLIL
jgi:hypothetical protein